MSLSLGKFRLGRAQKPARDPEGRMTLFEHLAELRSRLLKAVLVLVLGTVVAWFFYPQLFQIIQQPLVTAIETLPPALEDNVKTNWGNVSGPFVTQLQICLVAGLVATCPVWLYQIWAFILPGLHRTERRWTMVFVATAAPLFIAGVVVGYLAMPKGLGVLFDFTPPTELSANYLGVGEYLSFILRVLIVFGIAFEIPIFVVLLNLVGVLSARRLSQWRAGIIFGIFIFAAVATPSLDPITMLLLALPMSMLYFLSELIARLIERSRRRRLAEEDPDLVVFGDDD